MGKQNLQAKNLYYFLVLFSWWTLSFRYTTSKHILPNQVLMSSWMYTLLGCLHAHFTAYNIFFLILYTVVHI